MWSGSCTETGLLVGRTFFRLGAVIAKKLPVVPVSAKAVVGVEVAVGGLNALFT